MRARARFLIVFIATVLLQDDHVGPFSQQAGLRSSLIQWAELRPQAESISQQATGNTPAGQKQEVRQLQVSGTVRSFSKTALVVSTLVGKETRDQIFVLHAKTKIQGTLASGARTTVYYHRENKKAIADRVVIWTQKDRPREPEQPQRPPTIGVAQARDPFAPLVGERAAADTEASEQLPPGKARLTIATVRLSGVVRTPNGMIAILSGPQQRVYFVREGDRLSDGQVVRIRMDAVEFREVRKDAFGGTVERTVARLLHP